MVAQDRSQGETASLEAQKLHQQIRGHASDEAEAEAMDSAN